MAEEEIQTEVVEEMHIRLAVAAAEVESRLGVEEAGVADRKAEVDSASTTTWKGAVWTRTER